MANHRDDVGLPDSGQGLACRYILFCTQLFIGLVNRYQDEDINSTDLRQFRIQAQRFSLWSDGFNAKEGGLDDIIMKEASLKDTVLTLLSAIGNSLVEITQSQKWYARRQHNALLELCSQIKQLNLQITDSFREDTTEDYDSDVSDDSFCYNSSIVASNLSQSHNPIEDIISYNDLLLDLVPTLSNNEPTDLQNCDLRPQHVTQERSSAGPSSLEVPVIAPNFPGKGTDRRKDWIQGHWLPVVFEQPYTSSTCPDSGSTGQTPFLQRPISGLPAEPQRYIDKAAAARKVLLTSN